MVLSHDSCLYMPLGITKLQHLAGVGDLLYLFIFSVGVMGCRETLVYPNVVFALFL